MKASIYVIGTELTNGTIQDSHIQFLSKNLFLSGYEVKRAVIVPDDGSLEKELSVCISDSDVVLVSGGLGPTSDDLTRNIIARQAGVSLVKNKQAWKTLYEKIGDRIYGANEKQTYIPYGFNLILNRLGTAPGFQGKIGTDGHSTIIVCMPGPPSELQDMFLNKVLPFLASYAGSFSLMEETSCYSVFLIAEAKLEDICRQCAVPGISWGTRFQQFCISLYVRGKTEEDRKAFISKVKKMAGEDLIAEKDGTSACDLLTETLLEKNLFICTAESCTSGLVAKLLTDKSGSSAYFWGGAVVYDNNAKINLVKVCEETLKKYGAVSEQTARQMAEGILKRALDSAKETDLSKDFVSVSVTGIAGPGKDESKKSVGTVCFGFSLSVRGKIKRTESVTLNFSANTSFNGRDSVRRRSAVCAFILCNLFLQGKDISQVVLQWKYI